MQLVIFFFLKSAGSYFFDSNFYNYMKKNITVLNRKNYIYSIKFAKILSNFRVLLYFKIFRYKLLII